MTQTISLLARLIDTLAPRSCTMCGGRLSITEEVICACCNHQLPRTGYSKSAYDNKLVRLFWGRIPIEKGTAFFFYKAHSNTSRLIYQLKYGHHPEIGECLGRIVAAELAQEAFFDEITAVVPVPLARQRERERGYNQSREIARGISAETGLPVLDKVIERISFHGSQTQKGRWERNENVEKAFRLLDASPLNNQHILLIDDVITSGATLVAAAKEVLKGENTKVSVLSLGFANNE
ncbi:ComF family protein [Prevotella sp.]